MAISSKIPIIRALWGSTERTLKEIYPKPLFDNELAIVWGSENKRYLESLGYQVKVLSVDETDSKYSSLHNHYIHKIEAIRIAGVLYDEYIFLDWDCFPLRYFDDTFFNHLRNGNEVQIPLYAYPNEKGLGISKMIQQSTPWTNTPLSKDLKEYIKAHEIQLREYSWLKDNLLISPNFGFVYSRRKSLGNELLTLIKENNIQNCVEEHAFYLWAGCTLDEYILKYEPKVIQGTSNDTRTYIYNYNYINDPVYKLNNYIESNIQKDLYLKHI